MSDHNTTSQTTNLIGNVASDDKSKVNFTPVSSDPSTFKFHPDDPESSISRIRFAMKGETKYYDPCERSSKMSLRCLEENQDDKFKCQEFFDAYRDCKRQWLAAKKSNAMQWRR